MKPERQSLELLGITRSKAKMYEYKVPAQYHITLTRDPAKLLSIAIGILGDYGKYDSLVEGEQSIIDSKNELLFSAQYFDSYVESRLDMTFTDYFLMIGSASYYLSDLPGSASVLANRINKIVPDMGGEGLEQLLIWLLKNDQTQSVIFEESPFLNHLERILNKVKSFTKDGTNEKEIIGELDSLCNLAYSHGTARQLLLADIIRSITKKQINNSTWSSLSRYTGIDIDLWKESILKPTFIREFWPAQKLLGEKGVFKGNSAIIQMPTSAGKTKSIEIIIRSSFLSGRAKMAIIIAPFRALCSEIKNSLQLSFKDEAISVDEPSDVLQSDFEILDEFNFEESNLVMIVTPEKFMYILRSTPEIASKIGLLIYDEGHQFDNGIRGVTYELLLSSLKNMISDNTQIVLISAVISNAESIGKWLISGNKEIVEGLGLSPTFRTVAFTSWQTQLGMLQFIKHNSPEENEYFVPRILEQTSLQLKGRETKERLFPDKDDGKSIALYFAIKLIENGPVAIFCGSKLTVKSIYEQVVDLESRNYKFDPPLKFSDSAEVKKLTFLHSQHFGEESVITQSTKLGVFAHSGNSPQGLRLAIEHSMQTGKIKFVICTSTLAQGVNLPIKYLLITSFYQAGQKIKTRDFHNLIGRAGRSGIHTEGSIIFTDRELFDNKINFTENWKWSQAMTLLDPLNSEPCGSTLLSIFNPLVSDDGKFNINVNPIEFVEAYIESPEDVKKLLVEFSNENLDKKFTVAGLSIQINYKIQIISAIESFLMAHWDSMELGSNEGSVDELAKETLAYFLSDDEQKQQILQLFNLLGNNVKSKITTPIKRFSFSRTLFGVQDILDIENWVNNNISALLESNSIEQLLIDIWPILYEKANNQTLKKLTPTQSGLDFAKEWIEGTSYLEIFNHLVTAGVKITAGTQIRNLNQEIIIDICEGAFAYDTTLAVSAITRVINLGEIEGIEQLNDNLNLLQKRIKYGLPTQLAISFYEIGFADRIVAMDLAQQFHTFSNIRRNLIENIKTQKNDILNVLEKYPEYFKNQLNIIANT